MYNSRSNDLNRGYHNRPRGSMQSVRSQRHPTYGSHRDPTYGSQGDPTYSSEYGQTPAYTSDYAQSKVHYNPVYGKLPPSEDIENKEDEPVYSTPLMKDYEAGARSQPGTLPIHPGVGGMPRLSESMPRQAASFPRLPGTVPRHYGGASGVIGNAPRYGGSMPRLANGRPRPQHNGSMPRPSRNRGSAPQIPHTDTIPSPEYPAPVYDRPRQGDTRY